MTDYVLVRDGVIVQRGALPMIYDAVTYGTEPRPLTPEEMSAHGWHEVVEAPRPTDTETHIHESNVEFVDGTANEVWTARERTNDELDAYFESFNAEIVRDRIAEAFENLQLVISATTTYIDTEAPTQAQTIAHVKILSRATRELAQNQRKIIRLLSGVFDGID